MTHVQEVLDRLPQEWMLGEVERYPFNAGPKILLRPAPIKTRRATHVYLNDKFPLDADKDPTEQMTEKVRQVVTHEIPSGMELLGIEEAVEGLIIFWSMKEAA